MSELVKKVEMSEYNIYEDCTKIVKENPKSVGTKTLLNINHAYEIEKLKLTKTFFGRTIELNFSHSYPLSIPNSIYT